MAQTTGERTEKQRDARLVGIPLEIVDAPAQDSKRLLNTGQFLILYFKIIRIPCNQFKNYIKRFLIVYYKQNL